MSISAQTYWHLFRFGNTMFFLPCRLDHGTCFGSALSTMSVFQKTCRLIILSCDTMTAVPSADRQLLDALLLSEHSLLIKQDYFLASLYFNNHSVNAGPCSFART